MSLKKFKYNICDFKTAQKRNLKNHIECIHEGKKQFKSHICDFKAAQKLQLKNHIQSVHERKKPYKCNICDLESVQKESLKIHIESVHEGTKVELVSKELNHFGMIADLFRQIRGHSTRFVIFCSF